MVHIALLRGINVGKGNRIRMAELKQALEEAGFRQVQTYIQSGNILLEDGGREADLVARMEEVIRNSFGLTVPVMLRTADEWERIVADCPYKPDTLADGESIQLALLRSPPSAEQIASLTAAKEGSPDVFHAVNREIYVRLGQSMLDSKLADQMHKKGEPMTVRNWRTVVKLAEMARTIAGASPV